MQPQGQTPEHIAPGHVAAAAVGTFADELARIQAFAGQPVTSAAELERNLGFIYRELFSADFAAYDIAAVRKNAGPTMQALLELRLSLRNQIAGWAKRGFMTRDVQKALRDVFRVTRYATDLLGELHIGHDKLPAGAKPARGFTGTNLNVLVNPAYHTGDDIAFRSGDVIVVRGQAHNSAAIARIGDIDSQFSHVGIVHAGPDGTPVFVEALIESGSVVSPLADALDHGLGRAILFRYRDADLAARAAHAIHAKVSKRKMRRIWYDFTMTLEGYRNLYCSKLVRLAFLLASKGDVALPAYTTRLARKNRDFLDRVGVKAVETFAPGDLEIDPRFDIVAEWADYRVTSSLRNQDMIATKLFEFMETDGYVFEEDTAIRLIGLFGRLSGLLSEDAKDLIADVVPKVPPNMRRKTIAVVAMLHKTAQPLLERLNAQERAVIDRTGHPPHPRDVLAALDDMKKQSGGRIGYLVVPGA
jgi:Permuted papain-like amidase enzyme, YaeF/YiiX, C92 family